MELASGQLKHPENLCKAKEKGKTEDKVNEKNAVRSTKRIVDIDNEDDDVSLPTTVYPRRKESIKRTKTVVDVAVDDAENLRKAKAKEKEKTKGQAKEKDATMRLVDVDEDDDVSLPTPVYSQHKESIKRRVEVIVAQEVDDTVVPLMKRLDERLEAHLQQAQTLHARSVDLIGKDALVLWLSTDAHFDNVEKYKATEMERAKSEIAQYKAEEMSRVAAEIGSMEKLSDDAQVALDQELAKKEQAFDQRLADRKEAFDKQLSYIKEIFDKDLDDRTRAFESEKREWEKNKLEFESKRKQFLKFEAVLKEQVMAAAASGRPPWNDAK